MYSFFRHKKFWLPLLTLVLIFVITELFLRLGWYNSWVKPNSYLGNVFNRVKAIEKVGLDKIDWITVGSSRIDWGIDHAKLAKAQELQGHKHVRMSFGSANFISTQANIHWSIENLSSLQGIMLGASEYTFSHFNTVNNQYKAAWPFKHHMDFENYQPLAENQKLEIILSQLAWYTYFDDIKSLLNNPIARKNELQKEAESIDPLLFKKNVNANLCAHALKTLQDCVKSTNKIKSYSGKNRGFRVVNKICNNNTAIKRAQLNAPMPTERDYQKLVNNWVNLINYVLEKDKQFTLVLLPEHESFDYIINPANASEITANVLARVAESPNFNLIDLRDILEGKQNCEYFSDPNHLNNKGIKLVTQAVLKHINNQAN